MSPAFLILKRLLCAGLCCVALSTQASDDKIVQEPSADIATAAVLANESPALSSASQTAPSSIPAIPSSIQPPAAINATPIGGGRHLVSVTLALFGIIALIVAISWFVKRFGQGGFTQSQHIKILSVMPLGTRERILLVDAAGQHLLLGITATTINTLHVFHEPVVLPEKGEQTSEFSRKLMAILQQKSSGTTGENNNNDDLAAR